MQKNLIADVEDEGRQNGRSEDGKGKKEVTGVERNNEFYPPRDLIDLAMHGVNSPVFEDRWDIGKVIEPIVESIYEQTKDKRHRKDFTIKDDIRSAAWDGFLAAFDEMRLLMLAFENMPIAWCYPEKYRQDGKSQEQVAAQIKASLAVLEKE